MSTIYEECNDLYGENPYAVLQCLTERHEADVVSARGEFLEWFLVIASALVFFKQTGFAMLCAGCVRRKNAQNTMMKNLLDACGAAVAFFCTGYAFGFGTEDGSTSKSFIGNHNFFARGDNINMAFWFFQYACSATTVTIVAGTLAERCKMSAYLAYSSLLAGFVYPVVAHALWSSQGILSAGTATPFMGTGVVDFAGSGVVHLTGGATAWVASYFLGPRRGRFYHHRTGEPLKVPREFPGHSTALQLIGTMILWFGWYGFNPGSALLLGPGFEVGRIACDCAVNTSIAAAAGGVTGLLANLYIQERRTGEIHYELTAAMNGVLSGLVAITAGCATVDVWAAALIGTIAGFLYLASSAFLVRIKIDDVVEAIPVHCFNGAWGLIATGLFSTPQSLQEIYGIEDHVGWVYSWGRGSVDATLLFGQIMALVFISGWVILTMGPFFYMLRHLQWFRIEKVDELLGLDQMLHGGTPDQDGGSNASSKPAGFIRGLLGNSEHSASSHQHGL